MTSAIDRLNDWLYRAAPGDNIFFTRYPPALDEFTVTAGDLTGGIHPAPLPEGDSSPPPPEPPPVTPPPPPAEDTLTVIASYGLTIRAQPSPTATAKGTMSKDDTVTVSGHYAAKTADGTPIDYGQLLRVNGLKYADIGFIARSKGSEVYLSLKV